MNASATDVLTRTPPWMFVLFIYLVWIGLLRLRPSVRDVGKTWITPSIFIGSLGGMKKVLVDRPRQLVRLRGSVIPLLRILLIFGAHYGLQVAAAVQPGNQATFQAWDIYVSGASAGYFFGWSIRFLRAYRLAPQVDLAPVVARLKRRASA